MRPLVILAAVTVAALGLTACEPETPDTNKVLVVGDSVAFGIGCLLGDEGDGLASPGDCPAQPGFKTKNKYNGACTISLGTVLGHNGNLYASGCSSWQDQWQQYIDGPKKPYELVVLSTSGWEIVDRWVGANPGGTPGNWSPTPNYHFGTADFEKAANRYASKLRKAINILKSRGAKVLVFNAPYPNPPSVDSSGTYYEAYGPGQPGNWTSPSTGVTFRAAEEKVEQLNEIQRLVVSEFDPAKVTLWDFIGPTSLPGDGFDGLDVAAEVSVSGGPTSPGHACTILDLLTCITLRQGDGLHFTPAALDEVIGPLLLPVVRGQLGV